MTLLAGLIFGCLCVRSGIICFEKNKKISQIYIVCGLTGFFMGVAFFLINIAGLALNPIQVIMFIIMVVVVGKHNICKSLQQSLDNKHRVVIYLILILRKTI